MKSARAKSALHCTLPAPGPKSQMPPPGPAREPPGPTPPGPYPPPPGGVGPWGLQAALPLASRGIVGNHGSPGASREPKGGGQEALPVPQGCPGREYYTPILGSYPEEAAEGPILTKRGLGGPGSP